MGGVDASSYGWVGVGGALKPSRYCFLNSAFTSAVRGCDPMKRGLKQRLDPSPWFDREITGIGLRLALAPLIDSGVIANSLLPPTEQVPSLFGATGSHHVRVTVATFLSFLMQM